MATQTQNFVRVNGVFMPDGKRRGFQQNGFTESGNMKGFVQATYEGKLVSISGFLKRRRGRQETYNFVPFFHSKNIAAIRPKALENGTKVRIVGSEDVGTVVGVEWSYLDPTYTVQPPDRRRKAYQATGTDMLEVVEA